MAHRAVRYKLLPGSRGNGVMLSKIAGANRYVWNHFVGAKREEYAAFKEGKREKPSLSFYGMGKEFTELRREVPWLQELPHKEVKYVLRHLADAYRCLLYTSPSPRDS